MQRDIKRNVAHAGEVVAPRAQRGALDPDITDGTGDAGGDFLDRQVIEIHGVPAWLGAIVQDVIAKCLALRLPGGPAAKMAPHMVSVWCEALMATRIAWRRETDEARLRSAWKSMLPTLESWPTPAVFLRHLPARAPQKSLPPPPATAEEKARARAILAGIGEMLKAKGVCDARGKTGKE